MGFAIISDAGKGHELGIAILALVDRAKSRALWWTSDNPGIAIHYRSESAARYAARRLKHNNARVVPFDEAARQLREQHNEIIHNFAMMDTEQGWDSHKEAF